MSSSGVLHFLVSNSAASPATLRIAIESHGNTAARSTFVLLPGLGDLRQVYRFLVPLLLAGGHRVICLDLRGMGDSDASFTSYTPEDTGRDILRLLEQGSYGRVVLVGCSMSAASVA